MNKTAIEALKKRFSEIEEEHMARWEAVHPEPEPPGVEEVIADLRAGRCDPDPAQIEKQLEGYFRYGESEFSEAVNTHGYQRWKEVHGEWERERKVRATAVARARKRFLDRAMFGSEHGFAMLEEFSKWQAA